MLALVSFLIIRAAATRHLPYNYSVKVASGPGHSKFHDRIPVRPIDRGTYSEHSIEQNTRVSKLWTLLLENQTKPLRCCPRQFLQIRLRHMLAEHPKPFLLLWLSGPWFLGLRFRLGLERVVF